MNEVPKPIRCLTGECETAHREMERFFRNTEEEVIRMLPGNALETSMHLNIREMELCLPGPVPQPTNEIAHMLLYKDYVVAVVMETRTEFNNVQYDFFKNLEGLANERK